jgi:predicted CopG family antitoxin
MQLNIYEKKKVVKTYNADTYDLMFGTVEDISDAVKLDEMKSGSDAEVFQAVIRLITTSKDTVKDLLKDIFEGLSDEELRNTKVREQAQVLVEVVNYTLSQLRKGTGTKN